MQNLKENIAMGWNYKKRLKQERLTIKNLSNKIKIFQFRDLFFILTIVLNDFV